MFDESPHRRARDEICTRTGHVRPSCSFWAWASSDGIRKSGVFVSFWLQTPLWVGGVWLPVNLLLKSERQWGRQKALGWNLLHLDIKEHLGEKVSHFVGCPFRLARGSNSSSSSPLHGATFPAWVKSEFQGSRGPTNTTSVD